MTNKEAKAKKISTIQAVGWLFSETPDIIYLASMRELGCEDKCVSSFHLLPKKAITEIKEIGND